MDPTSFSGPDTALPAVEGRQPSTALVADVPSQPASTPGDHWLSRAMALWLQDADEPATVLGQLSPH